MLIDPRIGRYDGEEPMVCAVSGEPVRGRPSSQYPLDGQHYYRVLAKRETGFDGEPRALKEAELRATIPSAVTAESAPNPFPARFIEPPATRPVLRTREDNQS